MKQLILAVLFGAVFCTPMVTSQTSGFSQQGKVTHEMKDEGYTIAHSSLPLNSRARIANASTGKEVEVTITRLIPASSSRIADVSSSVWQELGLSSDTDARIYTIVSARPQIVASQPAAPQTAVSVAARTQESAARTVQAGSAQTGSAGTGSGSLGDLPAGVKFENNNNFIINGNPVAPSAVASETRTSQPVVNSQQPQPAQPVVTYYETPPAQPAVTYYETRPQQTQPSVTYNETPPAQPAVTYETRPQQTIPPAGDVWAQIIKPPVTDTRPAQPAVTYETRPQQTPPAVNYYEPSPTQPIVRVDNPAYQPVVRVVNWPQTNQPPAPNETWTQTAPATAAYETPPGQPVVKIVNWGPQTNQQPFETQTSQPVTYETQTQQSPVKQAEKNLPEIRPNMINEISAQASRTYVLIDASPDTPVPSVTIDNVPQTYRSVRQDGRDRYSY